MELKAFVPALSEIVRERHGRHCSNLELLEKDVRLHLLLERLLAKPDLRENLLFKGGTCLIKGPLDYPRFSEDLDFTWRDQTAWEGRDGRFRDLSRPTRHAVRDGIMEAAGPLGLTPAGEDWLRYGQSSRMMTAYLKYTSEVSGLVGGIRIQINYVEPLLYRHANMDATSLLKGEKPIELELLDEDLTARYAAPLACKAYDPREIVAEKGRAILTRQAAKVRDVFDLYLLERDLGLRVDDHLEAVRRKVEFAIESAQRYGEQLDLRAERFKALAEEDVRPLLLKPIDMRAFEAYRARVLPLLEEEARQITDGL